MVQSYNAVLGYLLSTPSSTGRRQVGTCRGGGEEEE
jgi:hypothetical protein